MKFGKHPVNIAPSEFGELKGLKNSLLNETKPNNAPKSKRLIPMILSRVFVFIKKYGLCKNALLLEQNERKTSSVSNVKHLPGTLPINSSLCEGYT